jgi:hypothetical protein
MAAASKQLAPAPIGRPLTVHIDECSMIFISMIESCSNEPSIGTP